MKIISIYILVLLLYGCRNNIGINTEDKPQLYAAPISIGLNTNKGYSINTITGDSIKPLISSSGYVFKTGEPFSLITQHIDDAILNSAEIENVKEEVTLLPDNVHYISKKPPITDLDTTRLIKIKLGEGEQSHLIKNSFGVATTGVPIRVTGRKMPFAERPPVKAAPMRFKDNATANIQYLDVDQGLSSSYVYAVCEDKNNNLWLGLDGTGISKYDGVNVTTYSVKEGLTNNIVTAIIEDKNEHLWIGTHDGVCMFDGKNFTQFTQKEGLPSAEILSIFEDKKGNLWFTSMAGVTKYDGETFTIFTRKEGLPSDTVYQCIEDKNGNIWFATYYGAVKFDGNIFTTYTKECGLPANGVSNLLEDKNGNIWLCLGAKGLCKFDGKKFIHFSNQQELTDYRIWSMMKDSEGNIWFSTSGGGLNKFNGKQITCYNLEQGLSNSKPRIAIQDKNGNIWFGTDGGGLNKLNTSSFSYKIPDKVVENNRIRPILKDSNGDLWFGTEGAQVGKLSTNSFAVNKKQFTYYHIQDKTSTGQRSLLEDKNGNIWIGTTGAGVIKYDGKNFTQFSFGTDITRQCIFDIQQDSKGNIWFGTRDGSIIKYNGKKFSFLTTVNGLPASIIYSIYEDKKGNIWFCTEGAGVYKYDGKNLIIYAEKEGLFNKSITCITEDENGNIWLGSQGAGVCKFDGKSFIYYSQKQGLSNDNVWSVFHDSLNRIWVGSDNGLTLFAKQKNDTDNLKSNYLLYNFGANDGLKATDFNLHSVCVDDDNNLWWGTGKGVATLALNNNNSTNNPPPLHLNYIEINEQFYDFRNLPDSLKHSIGFNSVMPYYNYPENLSLAYNQNHITFYFSAIEWQAPQKIKYSYRIIGIDNQWSKPSSEPVADYRNISHGNYEFQVMAIGQSQVWTTPVSYHFTINPAWWQTWWFKVFIVTLASLLLLYISRLIYLSRLRKQRSILEKQLAVQLERQRISAEMHDDIGAGLSGIKLMTEMTKTKFKDAESVTDINNIYQSLGDISAKMKEVIWSLNTENDNLPSLASFIQKQVRVWLQHYPCQLMIEVAGNMPFAEISGEARRNILLLVKEAVHNIIKHSDADLVTLFISYEKKLIITVTDNGKGMTELENKNTAGNGIKNMHRRMQQLNGKLTTKNKNGTTLIFEIPIKQAI